MNAKISPPLLLVLLATSNCLAQSLPGANLSITGIPAFPQSLVDRTNQYLNVRSAGFAGWDASGNGMYVTTRFGNTTQVHVVESPGAARQQITFFEEPVSRAAGDPRVDRRGFLFMKDVGGGEFYQMFYFDRATGTYAMLTDGSSRNEGMRWSPKGSYIAFSSTRRNKRDTDVWIMEPDAANKPRLLTDKDGSWAVETWSPDERQVLVSHGVSANESHPYLVDLSTREMKSLEDQADRKAAYGNFEWSADGKTIYFTTDLETEYQALYAYDVASGKRTTVLPHAEWDIEQIALSKDGRFIAYSLNEDGISVLQVLRFGDSTALKLPRTPVGIIGGLQFDPKSSRLGFSMNMATGPGDVYSIDLKTMKLDRWTFSEVGGLDTRSFLEPKLIHYPTFDQIHGQQRSIPAFFYRPRSVDGTIPVIIDIHGGPEGQSRPGFSPLHQYYAKELGCAVLVPNVRGSTGYGKTYLALDNGFNREHSVRDVGALLDWIENQPELDATRVAVVGGSYGGYMVLASLTTFPERIRCGVDVVGISNFVSFLQNTESYRRDLRRVEYGDERDPAMNEYLSRIAPSNNATRIRSPLFVVQGENDPRVPASEARQIVKAVEGNGIPVWTLFAKDEGHGFQKKNNRDYLTRSVILFFQEFLLK